MDSEDKRSAPIVSSGECSGRPSGYVHREYPPHTHKKPLPKIPGRSDSKRAELDKRKKKKTEELEKPEKREPEIVLPAKREKKALTLMFVDGSELTETVVHEELKKHHIEVELPAKKEEAVSAVDVPSAEASKSLISEEAEAAVDDKKLEKESNAGLPQEKEEISKQEKSESSGLLEKHTEGQAEKTEVASKEKSEPIDYEIVAGIPTGIDPVTGEKRNAWGAGGADLLRASVFQNRKPPISSRASALPVRVKKKPSVPDTSAETKTFSPPEREKNPEKERKELSVGKANAESVDKLAKGIQKLKIRVDEEKPVVFETKTEGQVSESVLEEKKEPVEQEVLSPTSELFKSLETEEITTLPIVYSMKQLQGLKAFAEDVVLPIDKSIFQRSSGFGKKKREFKTLKTGSFKDTRKAPLPTTVFDSIETYVAEFNLALNQVCLNNIDEVARRILAIKVPTEEAMVELTNTFFNRAMKEQAYTEIYAALVDKIHKKFRAETEPPYDENSYSREKIEKKSIFGRTLAVLAQKEFFSHQTWASDQTEHKAVSMSAEKLAERVMEISSNKEKEYERIRVKKRALTMVRFAIELYLQGVFSDTLMHSATHFIIEKKTPENVEKVCYILKHVGKRFDQPPNKELMDKYIQWLDEASVGLGSRYRFIVEDVKSLRDNGWVSAETRKTESEDEDGWKSSKTKEKKKFVKEKTEKKKDKEFKLQKVSDVIDANEDEYRKTESFVVSLLRCKTATFSAADQAKRLAAEYSNSLLFFVALIKITVEGYEDTLENGTQLTKEWLRIASIAAQRKDEVFEYIEEIMPDLLDDAPRAPQHLENLKKATHK